MSKLTLSVDKEVVEQARKYAKRRGTSVSKMVETYLAAVATPASEEQSLRDTPVLKALRGCLRGADVKDAREEHRKHLVAKHR